MSNQLPFFHRQTRHPDELPGVVGYQDGIARQGVRGNQQVHRANDVAMALEVGANACVVLGCLHRPGLHIKAGKPRLYCGGKARLGQLGGSKA